MDRVKYVITKYGLTDTIFVFPAHVEHLKFAEHMGTVLSAGFVNIATKTCYGRSSSLNLESNPEVDNILLRILLREG